MKPFHPMAILVKMEGYPPAVMASVLIHAVLVYFMLDKTVESREYMDVDQPIYINASAVEQNPQRLRRLERIEQERLTRQQEERARRDREAREADLQRRQREEAEARQREEDRIRAAEEDARVERERLAELQRQRELDEQARERQQEQERLASEQAARELAARDAAQAQSQQLAAENLLVAQFSATIRRIITQSWIIPPSARNGMTVVVNLRLVPTGEVVSVNIIQSSGNTVFDRSALQAVERAGSFPELQELDNSVFERHFRSLELLFRPEDLLR